MKVKQIRFIDEMLTAIDEGRKTQTRRIIECINSITVNHDTGIQKYHTFNGIDLSTISVSDFMSQCPYGVSGDFLRLENEILLQITNVRVERLQDITVCDMESEGIIPEEVPDCPCCGDCECTYHEGRRVCEISETEPFEKLWDSIYAKRAPWESNPWVWVIEFESVK